METGLAGKGVLVTGGSGGIGAACVRAFRTEGARVPARGDADRTWQPRPRRLADYAAAKGALHTGLLLSLKNEIVRVAPRGRVNAVAPGWTESPMTRGHVDPARVRRISRTMALRKVAQPEDVAAQVVALASDVISGHVSGQLVTVAGGMEGRVVHDP